MAWMAEYYHLSTTFAVKQADTRPIFRVRAVETEVHGYGLSHRGSLTGLRLVRECLCSGDGEAELTVKFRKKK